jgi:tRNA(fMet)-specific endonuclease VapC
VNFFLDTNTCIYFLKGKHPEIRRRINALSADQIRVPSMVQAELLLGAQKSTRGEATKSAIREFLAPYEIVAFDQSAAAHYAEIRAHLERKGTPIGPNDLVIAATVLCRGGCLITSNVKEFRRVPGLQVEDWA